jgi:hypothetical protein
LLGALLREPLHQPSIVILKEHPDSACNLKIDLLLNNHTFQKKMPLMLATIGRINTTKKKKILRFCAL